MKIISRPPKRAIQRELDACCNCGKAPMKVVLTRTNADGCLSRELKCVSCNWGTTLHEPKKGHVRNPLNKYADTDADGRKEKVVT